MRFDFIHNMVLWWTWGWSRFWWFGVGRRRILKLHGWIQVGFDSDTWLPWWTMRTELCIFVLLKPVVAPLHPYTPRHTIPSSMFCEAVIAISESQFSKFPNPLSSQFSHATVYASLTQPHSELTQRHSASFVLRKAYATRHFLRISAILPYASSGMNRCVPSCTSAKTYTVQLAKKCWHPTKLIPK